MASNKREANFNKYCPLCKYEELDESDDICNECLTFSYNIDSRKPVLFEEKDDAKD